VPFKITTEQAAFTFTVNSDGLPLAKVITLGGSRWIACCPCCGMIHDLMAHRGDVYEPQCIVRVTHPHVYQAWQAKHVDAASHRRVRLVTPDQWAAQVPPVVAIVKKPSRKAKKAA